MVEATEFPHLSQKYNVRGVPRTVINESTYVEGAAPEAMVLSKIFESFFLKKLYLCFLGHWRDMHTTFLLDAPAAAAH